MEKLKLVTEQPTQQSRARKATANVPQPTLSQPLPYQQQLGTLAIKGSKELALEMAQSLTSGQMPVLSERQARIMVLIQQSQRRTGAWLIQPGPEMLLEISVWELECNGIPDEKIDAAFRRGWDRWDGKGAFCAWDVIEAYRAMILESQQAEATKRELWIRHHPGEYLCSFCRDSKSAVVWLVVAGQWKGGARPCKCQPVDFNVWHCGKDGTWARLADLAKYGPPHGRFSHEDQKNSRIDNP